MNVKPVRPDVAKERASTLRIAVVLGTGGSGRDLLQRVQPLLGKERDVEMQGVFIEEAEVRYAAELPFVQELCRVTFNVREFTSDQFERALALRMHTARRALELLASRAGIRHSFQNVRGTALSLLRETAETSDITVFEPVRRVDTPLAGDRHRRNIVAVVSGPESVAGVVHAALRLAGGRAGWLTVMMLPRPGVSTSGLEQEVREVLNGQPLHARIAVIRDTAAVAEVARKLGASMLVLPAEPELMNGGVLRQLRDELRCPVCLVRHWKGGEE